MNKSSWNSIGDRHCKRCGKTVNEDIYDDNNGICDDCFSDTDGNEHTDSGLGDYDINKY